MRVLTYNIHKGIGGRDRRYDLARIVAVLEEAQADILCLQEVDRHVKRSGYDDQPQLLAAHFKPSASMYQLNHRVGQGGYGNLLLSRWPMSEVRHLSLTLHYRKCRGAQVVRVETPQGSLRLVSVHLGLLEKQRRQQIRRLLEQEELCDADGPPVLLVGDFNDWRNRLCARELERNGFRHATHPPRSFRTFPAMLPLLAVDKVFHRGGINIEKIRVMGSMAARQASDHRPLLLEVELTPPGGTPGAALSDSR